MKVQLGGDPLYEVLESPVKALKEKEIERQKQLRHQRNHPTVKKREPPIIVVDPLPEELNLYKQETSYKKAVQSSKASESLKKYIIQQEKNLRCLRLEKIADDQEVQNTSRLQSMSLKMSKIQQNEKNSKQIHIPRIDDLFKNQSRQILVHQNTTLRQRLGKMMNSLDHNMSKFKSMSFTHAKKQGNQNTTEGFNKTKAVLQNNNEEDYQIDKIIEKKLKKSELLRQKLYKEKRQMYGKSPGENVNNSNNMTYFLRPVEKPKRRQLLKGIKYYSYKDGNRNLNLTSASGLLFQLHKLSDEKDRKEGELTGLLKNSFQNRDTILLEKQKFYESQNPFNDLSPAKQFQLRKIMNKKLNKRLEISKMQINKFTQYLSEIKDYHVILNQTILQILREVREALLKGKVMKITDLENILCTKNQECLRKYPNQLIVKKLTEMMI